MNIDKLVDYLQREKYDRRTFGKKVVNGAKVGGLGLLLSKLGCKTSSENGNGEGSLYILDFYNKPVNGVVSTDWGDYPIANGSAHVYYSNPKCEIQVNGNVTYEAFIDGRDVYKVIPDKWETFFAHNNIAGNGSNKFIAPISTYIDTSNGSEDYNTVVSRLGIAGDGRASGVTSNKDTANFIIYLNSDRNGHGEDIDGKGTITECEIHLKNNNNQFAKFEDVVDEEISQGLTHTGNVDPGVPPPEGIDSCIAGALKGWKPIDSNIMDALYSMKNCSFYGNGFCKEN